MFTGLTSATCAEAWRITRASINQAFSEGTINKFAGTIIVLDPHNGEVLFEAHANRDHLKHELYAKIALAKARVSWKTGLPSRVVQQEAPHLYQEGMTKWGGAVIEHKLVVAFSGVQAVFDEAISWTMLSWIFAICRDEMTKDDGVMAAKSSFIGGGELALEARED